MSWINDFYKIHSQFIGLFMDKLVVCKKEIVNLKRTISFYEDVTKEQNTIYSSQLKLVYEDLEKLENKIIDIAEGLRNVSNENANMTTIEKILLFGKYESEIIVIIRKIGLLQRKIMQVNEDIFDQYMPKASLQRRHSNKALSGFIENELKMIYSKYSRNSRSCTNKENVILVWGYRNQFRVYNSLFQIGESEGYPIIENSFWYHEIPRLIPGLAHEVGHLIFKEYIKDHDVLKRVRSSIKEYVDKTPEIDPLFKRNGDVDYIEPIEEFIGDAIAYNEYGAFYILSFFYTIFPYQFRENFAKLHEGGMGGLDINDAYIRKFAFILARLYVLLKTYLNSELSESELINEYKIDKEVHSNIVEIAQLLDFMFGLSLLDKKPPFMSVIGRTCSEHKELKSNYLDFVSTTVELANSILTVYSELDFILGSEAEHKSSSTVDNGLNGQESKESRIGSSYDAFSVIWSKHLNYPDQWHHPSVLRKELLKTMFEEGQDNLEPFELTFVKYRIDGNGLPTLKDATKLIKSNVFYEINDDGEVPSEDISAWTYGLYSQALLLKKSVSLSYFPKDKNSSSDSKYIYDYLSDVFKLQQGYHQFYIYKIPIIQLIPFNPHMKKMFYVFVQVTLHERSDIQKTSRAGNVNNREESLKLFIEWISDYFKTSRLDYGLFKTLGPHDFLLVYQAETLEEVYEIKKEILSNKYVKRTYTVIGWGKDDSENAVFNSKKFKAVSKLRYSYSKVKSAALEGTYNDVKNVLLQIEDKLDNAYLTTGVTDVEIFWDNIMNPKEVIDSVVKSTDELINKDRRTGHIRFSDVQTFIVEDIFKFKQAHMIRKLRILKQRRLAKRKNLKYRRLKR